MRLRVGLNLLHVEPGRTGGMEVYSRALVPRLPGAWPDADFVAFAGNELAAEWRERPWHPEVSLVDLGVSSSTRILRSVVEQTVFAAATTRHRIDLLHSHASVAPLLAPVPQVVTVHDVIYKRHPDAHAGILNRGMALLVPASAHRARRVITGSHAAAEDITRFLGVDPTKVDVILDGPGVVSGAAPTAEAELRDRLGLPDGPFVLSPSARRPHKNLERLFHAMAGVDATLVVLGYPSASDGDLHAAADGARVIFRDWVCDEDLEGLYRAATCLAFPSLAEGFGLPVLEAMQRGLPVACSNATSLPEVAGDAALLFDPYDVGAIGDAIRRLVTDAALREQLRERGVAQAARFSWDATAAGTVDSYLRALA